jgi:hypothetical protein
VEERLQKHLSSWKGKLLSLGRRLVLINSVLTNMVLYMISFFLQPKGVLHKIDYYRSRFFWQGDSKKKKYRLVKWIVCRPKDQGGLEFMTFRLRTQLSSENGFLSFLPRMGSSKLYLEESTLVRRRYLKWFGNLGIHISGLV